MEIIKHGKTYKAQEKVCPNCECVFTYVKKDIKHLYFDIIYSYIKCPECGKTIIVKDYRK